MKKTLSLLMAVIMIFSSFTVASFAVHTKDGQETTYGALGIAGVYDDAYINKLVEKGVEVFGVSVDELYNNPSNIFLWNGVTTYDPIYDNAGAISKNKVSLLMGNLNMYLQKKIREISKDNGVYTPDNGFYTPNNAVKIINYIGNLFFPNFANLTSSAGLFDSRDYSYSDSLRVEEEPFFRVISERSGLAALIQSNWCNRSAFVNYRDFIYFFGVSDDQIIDRDYYRGSAIATTILKTFFSEISTTGPVNYGLELFRRYVSTYDAKYKDAVEALFAQRITAGEFTAKDLSTATGLLNVIFNNANKGAVDEFQFVKMPESKILRATLNSNAEAFLFLLVYGNINANYCNNKAIIQRFLNNSKDEKINAFVTYLSGENPEQLFTSTLAEDLMTFVVNNDYYQDFKDSIKGTLARIVQSIVNWFEMWIDIFLGNRDFGPPKN